MRISVLELLLLLAVLIVLKFTGYIHAPWAIVLIPLWVYLGFFVLVILLMVVVRLVTYYKG